MSANPFITGGNADNANVSLPSFNIDEIGGDVGDTKDVKNDSGDTRNDTNSDTLVNPFSLPNISLTDTTNAAKPQKINVFKTLMDGDNLANTNSDSNVDTISDNVTPVGFTQGVERADNDAKHSIAFNIDSSVADSLKEEESSLKVYVPSNMLPPEVRKVRKQVATEIFEQNGVNGRLLDYDTGVLVADDNTNANSKNLSQNLKKNSLAVKKKAAIEAAKTAEKQTKSGRKGSKPSTTVTKGQKKGKKVVRYTDSKTVDSEIMRRVQLAEWRAGLRVSFTQRDITGLDFLTRFSFSTMGQLARACGLSSVSTSMVRAKFNSWVRLGWVSLDPVFAGPELYYPKMDAVRLSQHPWLGKVAVSRLNPLSQSHSLGLSSIASWLIMAAECKNATKCPDILGLGVEWETLKQELKEKKSFIISEREVRSAWSTLRKSCKGLLPQEFRHYFCGSNGVFQQWGRKYKQGLATLADSPELLACDPSFTGEKMWIWCLFDNYVWNSKNLKIQAQTQGVPAEDYIRQHRMEGYSPIENRLDITTNKTILRYDLGDEFTTSDHLADLIVARQRDPKTGLSRSLAVELELSCKDAKEYARILAAYGSVLGKTLFKTVIWVVPNYTIAKTIRKGGSMVGMVENVDYMIVPFATMAHKNSFWSGADIIPAYFDKNNRVLMSVNPKDYLLN